MTGYLHFEKITQPWLRKATQDWAVDDAPRRRGTNPRGAMQTQINCVVRLSDSLRLNRPDKGTDPRLLSRDDIVAFLNRMRYLVQRGEVAAARHVVDVRHLWRMLLRMRSLGLTPSGQPLYGLSEQLTLRPEDIPDDPEVSEAGRDLPPEVMRQLCEHLDVLGAGDPRAPPGRTRPGGTRRPHRRGPGPDPAVCHRRPQNAGGHRPARHAEDEAAPARPPPREDRMTSSMIEGKRADSARRRERVIKVLDAALRTGDDITVSALPRAARVDRSFLHRHRDLLERVHTATNTRLPSHQDSDV